MKEWRMKAADICARYAAVVALAILASACSKHDKEKPVQSESTRTTTTTVAYRAVGNEPFWSVVIDAKGLRFVSPEDSAGVSFPAVEPVASGDTLRWASKNEYGRIVVIIWPDSCSDGMSDRVWSHSSAVTLNETSYVGCAESSTQPLR
jgi:uncharacterized membrane protein